MNHYFLATALSVVLTPAASFQVSPSPTISFRHNGHKMANQQFIKSPSPPLAQFRPLRAEPSEDAADDSSSPQKNKVRTMASFLVTQLLEKAMLEATKEKSKLSEADALALLETLQGASEAKNAQDNLSATWQAAEEAVEEKLLTDKKEEEESPVEAAAPTEPSNEIVVEEEEEEDNDDAVSLEVDTAASAPVEDTETPVVGETTTQVAPPSLPEEGAAAAEKEEFQRSLLAEKIQNDAKVSEPSPTPIITPPPKDLEIPSEQELPKVNDPEVLAKNEKFQRSLLAARIKNDEIASTAKPSPPGGVSALEPVVTKEDEVLPEKEEALPEAKDAAPPPVAATAFITTSMSSVPSMAPRIPDIISKDFGKPLEVAESDVPALRDSSTPKRSSAEELSTSSSTDSEEEEVVASTWVRGKVEEVEETPSETVVATTDVPIPADSPEDSSTTDNEEAEEYEAMALPVNEWEENQATESKAAVVAEGDSVASEGDLDDNDGEHEHEHDHDNDDEEAVTVLEPSRVTAAKEDEVPAAAAQVPTETREDGDDKDSTGPRDPLAEKYKDLSLEDKAFAILSDLGMIEKRQVSSSSSASSTVAPSSFDSKKKETERFSATTSDSDDNVATPSMSLSDTSPNKITAFETTATDDDDDDDDDGVEELRSDNDNDEDGVDDNPKRGRKRKCIQKRVVEPIRSFLSQSRTEPMFPPSSASPDPDEAQTLVVSTSQLRPAMELSPAIREARRQPKSPEEESALAAQYAQIQDLGDRAYEILQDLGMLRQI